MGLSVSVYQNIEKISEGSEDFSFSAYVIDPNWAHKIKNLESGQSYKGDCVYNGVSYSCSTHNRFREQLINVIGRKDLLGDDNKILWGKLTVDIPFYDFIDFADNEGCLDWETSAKIYEDFVKWNLLAQCTMDEYYYSKYSQWLKTFEVGKDRGVVVFH